MSEIFCQYGKKGVCKQQKVVALNEAMEWRNALEQRIVFLDHLDQLCKKHFAFTRQRYESGWDEVVEITEGK